MCRTNNFYFIGLNLVFALTCALYFCFAAGNVYPESIARVQDLTGKTVTFYEADITNKDSLRQVRTGSHSIARSDVCHQ